MKNFVWFEATYSLLAALYTVLFLITAIKLIFLRGRPWTFKKIFNIIIVFGSAARVGYFVLQLWIATGKFDNTINFILNTIPTVLFYSTYMLMAFFWAEISHSSRESHWIGVKQLRRLFVLFTVILYVGEGTLLICDGIFYGARYYSDVQGVRTPIERTVQISLAAVALASAVAFAYYGYSVYNTLKTMYGALHKRTIIRKVGLPSGLVAVCFLVRSAMDVAAAYYNFLNTSWWVIALFYTLLEILPLTFILFTLNYENNTSKQPADDTPHASVSAINHLGGPWGAKAPLLPPK